MLVYNKMNVKKYEKDIMSALTYEYVTPFNISKITKLNWFIVFGFLCLAAMEGRVEALKTDKNYLFRKFEELQ